MEYNTKKYTRFMKEVQDLALTTPFKSPLPYLKAPTISEPFSFKPTPELPPAPSQVDLPQEL